MLSSKSQNFPSTMEGFQTDSDSSPRIVQWFLDTRPLWPVPKQAKSQDEVQALKTVVSIPFYTRTAFSSAQCPLNPTGHKPAHTNQAAKELSLLSEPEQKSILRYHHIRDAKTKLASHLVKHFVITKYGNVPWSQSNISRGEKGKPFFQSPNPNPNPNPSSDTAAYSDPISRLDFNVSHQAGIVSLIAAINFPTKIDVGTDVVCVKERQKMDHAYIDREGFFAWVGMHADVFAEVELSEMKLKPVPVDLRVRGATLAGYGMDAISRCQWRGQVVSVKAFGRDGGDFEVKVQSDKVVDGKVRRFYAFWCLREAFVKMTGEAFAAPWLKELEILGVDAPTPYFGAGEESDLREGEVKTEFNIALRGKKLMDVKMELTALGDQYMIAGAVRVPPGQSIEMGRWVELDLKDILELAEGS
ncbi:hypothetical protein IFR05_013857 [Cadophora sp. M221]|nr:hypothetical protein IFR05_013857 [Cadophora sp. M221]